MSPILLVVDALAVPVTLRRVAAPGSRGEAHGEAAVSGGLVATMASAVAVARGMTCLLMGI
jgi:hypothetical protein